MPLSTVNTWRLARLSRVSASLPLALASHLFYTQHVTAQHQTRVKLNRVFFPR